MKNTIEFYYNLRIEELHNIKDKYFFTVGKKKFILEKIDSDISIMNDIYKLNYYLRNLNYIDYIILNRYNSPYTKIDNNYFILYEEKINITRENISLAIISNLARINIDNIKALERNNWELLWENKIDYFERQIGQNEKKYPLIRESIDYFIGLGENAIAYLVNTKNELKPALSDKKVLSHNTLNKSLSNPMNIILDHPARDVSEYIKLSFFQNNNNIFRELDEYFYYNHYSPYGIRVLFARIIYPSFYFDLYDNIISDKCEEKELNKIIARIDDYQKFLYQVYLYLLKYYNIPEIEWLKKARN